MFIQMSSSMRSLKFLLIFYDSGFFYSGALTFDFITFLVYFPKEKSLFLKDLSVRY